MDLKLDGRPSHMLNARRGRRRYSPSGTNITCFFTHGNVFVLGGHDFQTQFTHDLPAEKHVKE